ncbi:MAG: DUF11 domain-containing protein [Burkholderiaceae bacterium]|nr:DUF11 domain-containing protein [Burkholderiaceae bacterium]
MNPANLFPFRLHAWHLARLLLAALILALSATAGAQTCGLPGWDGPATPSGFINTYHAGSNSPGAGASSVDVASIAGQRTNTRSLRAGDLILIMQMQDSSSPATAGRHEYAQITAISGTTLQLNRTLSNSYARSMITSAVRNWQVVWVPQYSSATISGTVSADYWKVTAGVGVGSGDATGGVVAMDVAGSLALNGTVTVAGTGFRGGAGLNGAGTRAGGTYTDADYAFTTTVASMNGAIKGEGIEGTPINVFDGTATPVDYFSLLGQGYAAGAAGRGARSNAGGAGNDGGPAGVSGNTGNQLNSGGGGGSNAGGGGQGGNAWNQNTSGGILNQTAGGNTGNIAGGIGGISQSNTATRLVMGGGGGAGTANNGSASTITTWPPTVSGTAANGGAGSITSSGASGGGVVLIRAGSFSSTGGVVNADGYRAYNKSPTGDTDSAGGGGAGGSVSIRAISGSGAGLTINANGGAGGSSVYYNHGPGGGGGGGYVLTSFAGATINVAGGTNGTDACCGGTNGNGSPKAYNAAPGSSGSAVTTDGTPAGVNGGGACLPVINVTKSTLTPTITTATGATATYQINLANTGGAASNVFVFDANLPPNWTYTSTPASTYTYSPAPPPGAGSNAAGAQSPSATLPAGLPVSTATTVNSATAVVLTTTPGTVPTTGANSPTFGSFYLPQNSSITITYAVSIPDQATVGTYHNPAGVIFLDPTRTAAGGARMLSPLVGVTANRSGTAYSANTTYQTGASTTVLGTNSSGLVAGPTAENVTLLPDLSVTKTANTPTFTVGASGLQYVIVGRNNGRPVANQVYANTQATDASATAIVSASLSITDTLPSGMTLTAITNSGTPTWACTPNGTSTTFTCSAGSGVYPLAAATNLVTITATVAVSVGACPGPLVNTATFTTAALGEANAGNNTGTATTATGCGANLSVTKTNNATTVTAGGTTSYTVTFANLGPASADNASVKDTPGSGLACTVASCTPAGGAVCPVAGLWPNLLASSVTISPMPSGSTATFVVNCGITATGQ